MINDIPRSFQRCLRRMASTTDTAYTFRAVLAVIGLLALSACANTRDPGQTNALTASERGQVVVMDFSQPLALDPVPDGWRHRTFFRTEPMQIGFENHAGRPAIRLATNHSASMLYRFTDIDLAAYPTLAWDWFVATPVESDIDETSKEGDDHPARLYLKFQTGSGETRAMEIIWGNRALTRGDWKYLGEPGDSKRFPHYVARGGNDQIGRWHDESVDLQALYEQQWGSAKGARLIEVALFCDTDATAGTSLAYFSSVSLLARPAPQPQ